MTEGLLDRLREWCRRGEQMQASLDAALGPGTMVISDVVKADHRATIARGQFRGQPVYVRHYQDESADAVIRARTELDYLAQHLISDRFKAMPVIEALPEQGVLIVGEVPGQTVSDLLRRSDPSARAPLVQLCAEWLQTVTALRSETGTCSAARRLATLKHPETIRARDVVHALGRLHGELEVLSDRIDGVDILKGVGHGDFSPSNLIYDGSVLWGIDINGSAKLPFLQMAARFCSGARLWRSPEAIAAFSPGRFDLSGEWEPVFRFYLGCDLYERFAAEKYRDKDEIVGPEIDSFLSEPEHAS